MELEDLYIIEYTESTWSSPIVCIPKKNGQIRTCVDYTQVSKITPKNQFPFSNIEKMTQSIGRINPRYFTSLDLTKGFHQIEIHPLDRHKTAFITDEFKKQYRRLPFEWSNSQAIFQQLLQTILMDEIATGTVYVFIDDILNLYKRQIDPL